MNKKVKTTITVLTVITGVAAYLFNMPLMVDGTPGALNLIISTVFALLAAIFMYAFMDSKRLMTASIVYWSIALLAAALVIIAVAADFTVPAMMVLAMAALPPVFGIPVTLRPVSTAYLVTLGLIPLAFLVYAIILKKRQK